LYLSSKIQTLFSNGSKMNNYGVSDEIFNIQYDFIEYFLNEKQDEIKNHLVGGLTDKEDAVKLFLDCRKKCKPNSIKHNKLGDRYFMDERMVTKSLKRLSFFDFLKDARNIIEKTPSLKKTFAWMLLHGSSKHDLAPVFSLFRMYYGSMCGFKPSNAIDLYKKYNPTHIVDPCAGWGGRLLGAMALDIDYTGFDVNTHLKSNYDQLINELGEHSTSKVVMKFEDSLNAVISGIDYDMVFTSPPYFNIE